MRKNCPGVIWIFTDLQQNFFHGILMCTPKNIVHLFNLHIHCTPDEFCFSKRIKFKKDHTISQLVQLIFKITTKLIFIIIFKKSHNRIGWNEWNAQRKENSTWITNNRKRIWNAVCCITRLIASNSIFHAQFPLSFYTKTLFMY